MVRLVWLSPLLVMMMAACSQSKPEPDGGMAKTMSGDSAATQGYKAAMMSMMKQTPAFTGDADRDFMTQMRVHHRSAIDMATVELANGRDAEARALAQTIIDAQKAEIAQISAWLDKKAS